MLSVPYRDGQPRLFVVMSVIRLGSTERARESCAKQQGLHVYRQNRKLISNRTTALFGSFMVRYVGSSLQRHIFFKTHRWRCLMLIVTD